MVVPRTGFAAKVSFLGSPGNTNRGIVINYDKVSLFTEVSCVRVRYKSKSGDTRSSLMLRWLRQ